VSAFPPPDSLCLRRPLYFLASVPLALCAEDISNSSFFDCHSPSVANLLFLFTYVGVKPDAPATRRFKEPFFFVLVTCPLFLSPWITTCSPVSSRCYFPDPRLMPRVSILLLTKLPCFVSPTSFAVRYSTFRLYAISSICTSSASGPKDANLTYFAYVLSPISFSFDAVPHMRAGFFLTCHYFLGLASPPARTCFLVPQHLRSPSESRYSSGAEASCW